MIAALCSHPPAAYVAHPPTIAADGYTTCGLCNVRIEAPNPQPETSAADRLATELFRRYGEVTRGLFRTREHWVADATAVRTLLAGDAAFTKIVEVLTASPVHVSSDPEARAATWNEGFDEAWRQRDDLERESSRIRFVAIVVGLIAGAIAYGPVRLLLGRRR